MISKRVYLSLAAGLLMLGVGAGFAMRDKQSHQLAALQSLRTASLQLGKAGRLTPGQIKTQALIDQAIFNLTAAEMEENRAD